MKRITLIGLGILCLIPAASAEDDVTAARTFNSKLPLKVFVRTLDGDEEQIGVTPSEAPLEIPECRSWWVLPLASADIVATCQEVESQRTPGLKLFGATDDDLTHVGGLTDLRTLYLAGSVTDADRAASSRRSS